MESSHHGAQNNEAELNQQFANRLIANQLTIRQGGANSVEANELIMRQAAAGKISADQAHTNASAVGFLQSQAADIANSTVAVANVAGNLAMDQSGANVLVSAGEVTMDQSGSLVLVTRSVVMKNSSTAFLFAQHVEGDVTTLFNSRDALIFGTAAGLVGGLVILVSRIFRRRR